MSVPTHQRMRRSLSSALTALLGVTCLSTGCADPADFQEEGLGSADKIIGGYDDAAPSWMVSLRRDGGHFCGGSLVRDGWVLTAAHCVDWLPQDQISVCVGKAKLSDCDAGSTAKVSRVEIHESWSSDVIAGYDIALLKLDRGFPGPADLADTGAEPPSGTQVNARGWGVAGYQDGGIVLPNHMQRIKLPYRTAHDCHRNFEFKDGRTSNMETIICIESLGDANGPNADATTCHGDSGGPIHYQGRQIGIVSYGFVNEERRCVAGSPSGHTRVAAYRHWIDRTINAAEGREMNPRQRLFVTGELVSLKSSSGAYVCAEGGGGGELKANRDGVGEWERFEVVERGGNSIALRTSTGHFLSAEGGGGGALVANRDKIGGWEIFKVVELGGERFALETENGHFVVAEGGGGHTLLANRGGVGEWETFRVDRH